MHIPSERVYNEMLSESASIWFVPSKGDVANVILLKAPIHILKSIIKGCKVSIVFCICELSEGNILCTAVKIFDDSKSPFIITGAHREREEHLALIDILNCESNNVFLFDELNRCVSDSIVSFNNNDNMLNFLNKNGDFYHGPFTQFVSHAIDCLEISINISNSSVEAIKVPIIETDIKFDLFNDNTIHAYGENDNYIFEICKTDEGTGQEINVWQLLETLFKSNIYKSPFIHISKNPRELIDILAYSTYGIFLIESKAMSIFNTSNNRSSDRKIKNIQKQIMKALKQLKGSINALKKEYIITKMNSSEIIKFDRTKIPHAIVLVSELMPIRNGFWREIVKESFLISTDTNSMVHILDLRELSTLVSISKTVNHFDYYLMKRFEKYIEHKTVFLR